MHTQPHVTQFSLLISPCVPHHLSEQNFPRLMFQRTSDKRRVNFLVHKVSCFYWKDRQNWDCNRQRGAPLIQKETQLIPNVQIPVYGKKKLPSLLWKAQHEKQIITRPEEATTRWKFQLTSTSHETIICVIIFGLGERKKLFKNFA